MYNNNTLEILSLYISLLNLYENLSQSDKDDLIHSMSTSNGELLQKLEADLEEQNVMLREILTILKEERSHHERENRSESNRGY